MVKNFVFIEFQLCLRWTIGQLLALCKKLGKKLEKKNQKKYILKKIVSIFLKNHHLLKGAPFFSQHPLKGVGLSKPTLISVGFA
jgi:hypothetical protein